MLVGRGREKGGNHTELAPCEEFQWIHFLYLYLCWVFAWWDLVPLLMPSGPTRYPSPGSASRSFECRCLNWRKLIVDCWRPPWMVAFLSISPTPIATSSCWVPGSWINLVRKHWRLDSIYSELSTFLKRREEPGIHLGWRRKGKVCMLGGVRVDGIRLRAERRSWGWGGGGGAARWATLATTVLSHFCLYSFPYSFLPLLILPSSKPVPSLRGSPSPS